jgi:hypothetical protein
LDARVRLIEPDGCRGGRVTLEMQIDPLAELESFAAEPMPVVLRCSVGIMAYNEEANIAHAIATVFDQEVDNGVVDEVIVVASGCTDRTVDIVTALASDESRLRLIVEAERAGKASAINQFIADARSPVLVLVNADTLLLDGTIDALLHHFSDPTVGMVGGHPIPVNDDGTFLGYAVHTLWRLHDHIARETPKLGEIVAFRSVLAAIPTDTAVDELSLQLLLTGLGYRLVYEPKAVVHNRGPTTVGDFLRQRRRICAGHLRIAHDDGYVASTMSTRAVGRAVLTSQCFTVPRSQPLWAAGTITLEATARALGYYDFLRHRDHSIWTAVTSTKHDIAASSPTGAHCVLILHVERPVDHRAQAGPGDVTLVQRAAERVGVQATVSQPADGTIVVTVPGDRLLAERAASAVVTELGVEPTDDAEQAATVACTVVTFPERGQPSVQPLTALAS